MYHQGSLVKRVGKFLGVLVLSVVVVGLLYLSAYGNYQAYVRATGSNMEFLDYIMLQPQIIEVRK